MRTRYYYDKPDGEDLLNKVIVCVKNASLPGVVMGTFDALLRFKTNSTLHNLVIGLRPLTSVTGIAFVFATVTYMSTRLRGKDDPLNHGIGAIATAPIVKAWLRIPNVEVAQLMIFASLAMVINKARRNHPSGLEDPFRYTFRGYRQMAPNWDYWDYWTGAVQPLEDYSN